MNYWASVKALQSRRDEEIRGIKSRHPTLPAKQIAKLVGCHTDTVQRVLEPERREAANRLHRERWAAGRPRAGDETPIKAAFADVGRILSPADGRPGETRRARSDGSQTAELPAAAGVALGAAVGAGGQRAHRLPDHGDLGAR